MKNVNWGILGPGAIAEKFVQALHEVNGSAYAVGSRSFEKAKRFAKEHGVDQAYGSYEEMLKDEAIDAVYISTPHSNHYEYMMKTLHAGKHILCEKAITVNGTQLKEVLALAEEKNLIVSEAMTIFHMPLYKKLRGIVQTGKLGPLKMVQVTFGSCKENDPSNRFFNKELAGGALLDIGTYALSFVRPFLTSQPNEVLTTVKTYDTGVDEQSGIILKNDHEEMAVVSLTFRAKMPKRGIVACEKGFITVEDFPRADKATMTYVDGTTEEVQAGESGKALHYEIENMQEAILNGTPDATQTLTRDVMELMDEVRGQWGVRYEGE
ncbi:Gfo/Idh/MocA family protein [Shouchella shacheensis]|uniref:Gfo/Idh/MocA family protein n=1 Tax=Shouchella shacheensis TaxID=1649580 RepID=UPI0007404FCE|nr:Gfo/Idh/MocA family oxidoreductase [Shouchella shacheensis]